MKVEKQSVIDVFSSQPTWLRALSALVASALVAYYLPMLVVVVTGQWRNNLTDTKLVGAAVVLYIVQNLIGVAFRKPVLVGCIFAALWFAFFATAVLTTKRIQDWQAWWPVLFANEASSILNGYALWFLARSIMPSWVRRFERR